MKMEHLADQAPAIMAERFELRAVRRSDAGLLAFHSGDARVARMTSSIPHPLPPGATEAWVERVSKPGREEDAWIIDGTRSGWPEVIGVISLKHVIRGQSEIGYWVAPAFWNTGIASEAVKALIAANPLNDSTICAAVHQDNPGSARVLTQAGFDYLGDAETFSVARNARVPTWTYMKKLG